MKVKSAKKLIFNVFTLSLMIWMSKKFNVIIESFFPGRLHWLFSDRMLLFILVVSLTSVIIINLIDGMKLKVDFRYLIVFILLILDIIVVSIQYRSVIFSLPKTILLQVFSNFGILASLVCLTFLFQNEKEKLRGWFKLPLIFILMQSVIGIIQFITKSPLFPNSTQIIGNSYYINGVSNGNADVINHGGIFRASGFTNSSLTLGLFMLLGLVLTNYLDKVWQKRLLQIIFTITIFMTFTRIIWIAWVILVVFIYFPKIKDSLKIQLFISSLFLITQILIPNIQQIVALFGKNPFFSTMVSRFSGYSLFMDLFPINIFTFLGGQNFVTRIAEYKHIPYSLDNQFLVMLYNNGVIGLTIYIALNIVVLYKLNKLTEREKMLGKLLLVFPVIGITNDPFYFVSGMLALFLVFVIGTKKDDFNDESYISSHNEHE